MVVVGVDVHKQIHTFVAVDEVGRELGHKTFPAITAGHRAAVMWRGCCGVSSDRPSPGWRP